MPNLERAMSTLRIALPTSTLLAVLALAVLALAACGGATTPPDATTVPTRTGDRPQSEATAQVNGVSVQASAVQTSLLGAASAERYGIVRDPATVLLLVVVRNANGPTPPAAVAATATDLRGSRHAIAMHAVQVGDDAEDSVDYIGTLATSLPETLRFEVTVQPAGGGTARLQFSRDFYPQ